MPLFIVVSTETSSSAIINKKIPEHCSGYYDIGKGIWLVSFDGTARKLFAQLEENGVLNGCIVLRFSSYWGRYDQDLWDWISTEAAGGKRA